MNVIKSSDDLCFAKNFYPNNSAKEREKADRPICRNAFFWGLGNGLIGTPLVTYLVKDLAAGQTANSSVDSISVLPLGILISWIIAAPRLMGFFQILTPSLIDLVGNRKIFCIVGYLLSPLILFFLPLLVLFPEFFPEIKNLYQTNIYVVVLLIGGIWGFYHFFEYLAFIAFWSWIGDLFSGDERTKLIARRERFLLLGQTFGMIFAGLFTFWYSDIVSFSSNFVSSFISVSIPSFLFEKRSAYLFPALLGVLFLFLTVLFLFQIPDTGWTKGKSLYHRLTELLSPFRSRIFLPFLLFGIWIQLVNGLTQAPQSLFQIKILAVSLLTGLMLQNGTRFGQWSATQTTGHLILRFGNYPVMIISLLLVSCGPLFYFFAAPDTWFLIVGAAIVWIAWIGVNLGIRNLTLQLAPEKERTSFVAVAFMTSTLSFGFFSLLGGYLFDQFQKTPIVIPFFQELDYYRFSFLLSCFLRVFGVLFLIWGYRTLKAQEKKNNGYF